MTQRAPGGARHFETGSADYARYRPTYPPALAEALADLAPHRRLAVEVGCGAGQFTTLLADVFDAVVASDRSAAQVKAAPARENVVYRVGSAEAIEAEPGSAALIVAAQAAHWFDLPRFYDEVRRIASPGAVVALISYGLMDLDPALAGPTDRFYGEDLAPYWAPERRLVEGGYRDLPFPFAPIDPPQLAIERDLPREAYLGYIRTWSAVRDAAEAGRGDLYERFAEEVATVWPDPDETRRVRWPIAIRLGRL